MLIKQLKAARRVGTPLIGICTPDPAATMLSIAEALNGNTPIVRWDIVNGLIGLNEIGNSALLKLFQNTNTDQSNTINPTEALQLSLMLPEKTIMFFLNAHKFVDPEKDETGSVSQAIWNLRDEFKTDMRTLILLAPDLTLPSELRQDILVLEEPLPTDIELEKIVRELYNSTKEEYPDLEELTDKKLSSAVDATRGLANFSAEQVVAMSFTKEGLDNEILWEKKRQTIEQTPGLSVYKGKEKFSDIGGVINIKMFLSDIMKGNNAPRCLVFLDEINLVS